MLKNLKLALLGLETSMTEKRLNPVLILVPACGPTGLTWDQPGRLVMGHFSWIFISEGPDFVNPILIN